MAFALYAPTFGMPFVYEDWNDFESFYLPLDVSALARMPLRAATKLTLTLSQTMGGGNPWAYHAGNAAFHAVNSALVLLIGWRIAPAAGLAAGALFAVHPLQVEAVAYVSSRSDLVATFGVLLALLAASAGSLAGACLGLGLAVLGKETHAVAAGLVLLWAAWSQAPFPWRKLAALGAGGAVIALLAVGWSDLPIRYDFDHLMTTNGAIWRLALLVVWPFGFTIDHDWRGLPLFWLCFSVGLTVLSLSVAQYAVLSRERWWFAFCVLWVGCALFPRFLVPGVEGLHEHHMYLPMVGLCLGAGAGLASLTPAPTRITV